jgi:hypothetical protein
MQDLYIETTKKKCKIYTKMQELSVKTTKNAIENQYRSIQKVKNYPSKQKKCNRKSIQIYTKMQELSVETTKNAIENQYRSRKHTFFLFVMLFLKVLLLKVLMIAESNQ